MTQKALSKKIDLLDAYADSIKEIVSGLRSSTGGVSTPASLKKRPALSKDQEAKILSRMRKGMRK